MACQHTASCWPSKHTTHISSPPLPGLLLPQLLLLVVVLPHASCFMIFSGLYCTIQRLIMVTAPLGSVALVYYCFTCHHHHKPRMSSLVSSCLVGGHRSHHHLLLLFLNHAQLLPASRGRENVRVEWPSIIEASSSDVLISSRLLYYYYYFYYYFYYYYYYYYYYVLTFILSAVLETNPSQAFARPLNAFIRLFHGCHPSTHGL